MNLDLSSRKVSQALRLLAIAAIFILTSAAWFVLAASIAVRTEDADRSLRKKVEGLWGTEQRQSAPQMLVTWKKIRQAADEKGMSREVTEEETRPFPPSSSSISAEMDVDHRRKGLLWYNTYKIRFSGKYAFEAPPQDASGACLRFAFPAPGAIYDDFAFIVNGQSQTPSTEDGFLVFRLPEGSGPAALDVSYVSQGLDRWSYLFDAAGVSQVRDFSLALQTHFDGFDFPEGTLAPGSKEASGDGWLLRWDYKNLMAGASIGLQVPQKLNPGPIASRITFFAPVCLFFFFFTLFIITLLRGVSLHPMNYIFLAAAFFSFHLLFAYLVDHMDIHLSFGISAAVSMFLVASYLRLVTGLRFALVEAGLTQLVYLVLFSYAFFWEGFTGLTVTIGAVLTLFVMMQLTGRVNWNEKFSAPS